MTTTPTRVAHTATVAAFTPSAAAIASAVILVSMSTSIVALAGIAANTLLRRTVAATLGVRP